MRKITLVVLALALVSGACASSEDDPLDAMQARRSSTEGVVTVARSGESFEIEEVADLEVGDVVSTSPEATALIRLEGEGQTIALDGGSTIVIRDGDEVEASAGKLPRSSSTEDHRDVRRCPSGVIERHVPCRSPDDRHEGRDLRRDGLRRGSGRAPPRHRTVAAGIGFGRRHLRATSVSGRPW